MNGIIRGWNRVETSLKVMKMVRKTLSDILEMKKVSVANNNYETNKEEKEFGQKLLKAYLLSAWPFSKEVHVIAQIERRWQLFCVYI